MGNGLCPTGECSNWRKQLESLEERMDKVEKNQRNPAIAVALIGAGSACFGGFMVFAATVFGPLVRAWVGM